MRASLTRALDECLDRVATGETVESCLLNYPDLRAELESLLRTAAALHGQPEVTPSQEFRTNSKARIKARLYAGNSRTCSRHHRADKWAPAWRAVLRWLTGPEKAAPVAVTVALTVAAGLFLVTSLFFLSSPAPVKYQYALSVLNGEVDVWQASGTGWEEAEDGTWLRPGSRIKTADNSHALVTFFEGSTILLEPDTELEVQESEFAGRTRIVVGQAAGSTWISVPAGGPERHFEIKTPSASVTVMGTLFEVRVDDSGLTTVRTTKGAVSVTAQDKHVDIRAGQQVRVEYGRAPSEPEQVQAPESYLVFKVGAPALASVCDPAGASTGHIPGGISFSQIPGAYSTLSDESQVIYIPTPRTGQYSLLLRLQAGDAAFMVELEGTSRGETVVFETREYKLPGGSEWIIPVLVLLENGELADVRVDDIEPLGGRAPEKIIATGTGEPWLYEPGDSGERAVQGRTLTAMSDSGGSVKVPGEGKFEYEDGVFVELLAEPAQGYCFVSWIGDVTDPLSPATKVEMTEDRTVTAKFVRSFILTIISSEGGVVREPGQGVIFYCGGSAVTLVAEPREGWKFAGWTGNVLDRSSPVTSIVMDHSEIVCANFVRE